MRPRLTVAGMLILIVPAAILATVFRDRELLGTPLVIVGPVFAVGGTAALFALSHEVPRGFRIATVAVLGVLVLSILISSTS